MQGTVPTKGNLMAAEKQLATARLGNDLMERKKTILQASAARICSRWRRRKSRSFSASSLSPSARMPIAYSAAFLPPALPAVTAATGTPGGICTVASSESAAPNGADGTGIATIGLVV